MIIIIIFLHLVSKENPTLTAAQTAKKITEFWKQLSSEERGYYRDAAQEGEEHQASCKKAEEKGEANQADTENNKSRLLKLFEKMKNAKNEKKEKLNMRTIVPWIIDRTKIITRLNLQTIIWHYLSLYNVIIIIILQN